MQIINDFFLLVWGEKHEQQTTIDGQLPLELDEHFSDSAAILLIINSHNLSQIEQLSTSKAMFRGLFNTMPFNKENVQKVQHAILAYLIELGNQTINATITKRLELLRKEEIISYDLSRRLMSLISLIVEKKVPQKSLHVTQAQIGENFYKTAKNRLFACIENLCSIVENTSTDEQLKAILTKLDHQSFSIGVTGVMNAGKSTMLNALLGQAVLGTAVIPETANLTVIKYAKEPFAEVDFWRTKEWQKIEESALSLKGMEAFVKETREHFGTSLNSFVSDEGKKERIAIEDLSLYTSAKHSDKKCNLVKQVTLYTDLKFVQDGVQIVDTPGLDDPVIQREEITLEYLAGCDLLIHLMNAAQAATKKDIDFIIDALLYRNVAQLLIVITRIDAIKEKELQEVIAYTKESIKARLSEHNKDAKLDEIIAKIAFIPMAGKLALMHKTSREAEALALGYDFEKTGLPALERYLEEVLFGEQSQKAKLIINANQKEIERIATALEHMFHEEKRLLSISSEDLEKEIQAYRQEKEAIEAFLVRIGMSIAQSTQEMEHYFITLEKFANQKMDALKNLLKRRVLEDAIYEFSKNKRAPKEERISYMIESGIKDGLIDMVRDYRYEFQKKMQNILEHLSVQYGDFKTEALTHSFDAKTFCETQLGSLLVFKNNTILITSANEAIKKLGKSEQNALSLTLDTLFETELLTLREKMMEKISMINQGLLKEFTDMCEAPAHLIEERMNSKEEVLKKAMTIMHEQSSTRHERLSELEEKDTVLSSVFKDLGVQGSIK